MIHSMNSIEKRVECEKIHGNIKSTLNSISEAGETRVKKLYYLLSFIAYQLLLLTESQNKVGKNSFGRYF